MFSSFVDVILVLIIGNYNNHATNYVFVATKGFKERKRKVYTICKMTRESLMLIRWWINKKNKKSIIRIFWLKLDCIQTIMCSIYAKWGLFDEVLTDPINKSPQIQDNRPQEPPRSFCHSVFTTNALVKHAISQSFKCLVMRMMKCVYLLKLIKLTTGSN